MKKQKIRRTVARMIGAIPRVDYRSISWKIRLKAPFFPFFIDSEMGYATKADAEKVVERWSRRKITVEIK